MQNNESVYDEWEIEKIINEAWKKRKLVRCPLCKGEGDDPNLTYYDDGHTTCDICNGYGMITMKEKMRYVRNNKGIDNDNEIEIDLEWLYSNFKKDLIKDIEKYNILQIDKCTPKNYTLDALMERIEEEKWERWKYLYFAN